MSSSRRESLPPTRPHEHAHPGPQHLVRGVGRRGAVVGGDDVGRGDDVGGVELLARGEALAVDLHGLLERVRREVAGEGIGQPVGGGELGTEERRAEDVEGTLVPRPG